MVGTLQHSWMKDAFWASGTWHIYLPRMFTCMAYPCLRDRGGQLVSRDMLLQLQQSLHRHAPERATAYITAFYGRLSVGLGRGQGEHAVNVNQSCQECQGKDRGIGTVKYTVQITLGNLLEVELEVASP